MSTTAIAVHESWLESFKRVSARGPKWLQELRSRAFERFCALGFPTTKMEEWRFTNVAPIAKGVFTPAKGGKPSSDVGKAPNRLVFVDGRYVPELSSLAAVPKGVVFASLAGKPELAEKTLGCHAAFQDQAFVALNTALFEDGAFLSIPRGAVVEQPIYLHHISSGGGTVSHPRALIVAGAESQAAIVESFDGPAGAAYYSNPVTEIIAGPNAVLEHYSIQQDSDAAFRTATLHIHQERTSNVTDHNVSLGGKLTRNDVNFVLDGEGAEAHMYGLYVVTGESHVDNHTCLDNRKPHCPSREIYKGILDGKASAVFNGGIIVRQDAQKTDAKQSNKNLLLSEGASVNTKPQLQIWADDVKCTHGATIGQMDAESLFYMRSRGIGEREARNLLTFAFSNELLMKMKVNEVREALAQAVQHRLSK
jgi:Fe-S cluster assembly protein SufD